MPNGSFRLWIVLAAAAAGILAAAPSMAQDVVINEFWTHDSTLPSHEYIELYSRTGVDLAGFSVIALDGASGDNPSSSRYRRLALRVDFAAGDSIEPNGYLLLGGLLPAEYMADRTFSPTSVPNQDMTLAIVRTQDIETCTIHGACPEIDADELTAASVAAITANLIDAIGITDSDTAGPSHFNATSLPPNPDGYCWDAGARFPDGADTDSPTDWSTQDNFTLVLGSTEDMLSTPGRDNGSSTGACCLPGGACRSLMAAECVDLGGTYAGDDSACENVICSTNTAPPGCMCDVDGEDGTDVFDLLAFLDCWFEGCP